MSKATAFGTLLSTSLKSWLSAKGFWLVVLASLFPVVLTGAWVATHQDDVVAMDVTITPEDITEGDEVVFTAVVKNTGDTRVGEFNASLTVGRVTGNQLAGLASETITIDGLEPGATREIRMNWTAQPGAFYVLAYADSAEDIREKEEANNQVPVPVVVEYRAPTEDTRPVAPENLTGAENATATADLAITLADVPEDAQGGDNLTFTATVTNAGPDAVTDATVVLRAGFGMGGQFSPLRETTETVSLAPGESTDVVLEWPQASRGAYWLQAYVAAPESVTDPTADDNHAVTPLVIQPQAPPEFEPPVENATIKEFYLLVLSFLHLPILVPFIALFYAGGVVSDERERGNLTYILTRPIGRWTLPVAKFVAGFAVSAVAVTVGLVVSFLVLFGQPGSDVGFLSTPVLISLVALLVYGAFFVLLGVLVDRPYLIGVVFILGWETVAALFVPWVQNLTIRFHVVNAVQDWPFDEGFLILPPEGDGVRAVLVVLAAGLAFLLASAYAMQRREFRA